MALLSSYQDFRSVFEAQYHLKSKISSVLPNPGDQEKEKEILESRSLRALFELATVLRTDGSTSVKDVWASFHRAMQNNDKEKLQSMLPEKNVMSPQQILDIPQSMRVQLTPTYVVVGDKESLLYQQVEFAPKFLGALSVSNNSELSVNKAIQSFVFFSLDVATK